MLSYYLNCPDSKTNHCSDQIPDPKPKFIIKRNIKIKSIKFRKGRRYNNVYSLIDASKVIMQGKLFFVLQCTVFGRKRKNKTDVTSWHGIHFHKNKLWNILVIGNYYVNYQNYQNLMRLSSLVTRRTLIHLFLFTNFAQRELVSICTQSIRNRN